MPNLYVEILLQDELNEIWATWFEGLRVEKTENGSTRLSGIIADQAALHGLLERIRDLNLRLVSVQVAPIPPKGI
jgi:hypothetical protein